MRSKRDAKIDQRGKAKKPPPPVGGKVLLRLLDYLGERDPALTSEALATIALPKVARPAYGPAKPARRAKGAKAAAKKATAQAAERAPGRRAPPVAKPLAAAIAKAATALAKTSAEAVAPPRGRVVMAAPAALASGPATWKSIGPSLIPNGQTYGTNRVDVIGRVSSIAIDPGNVKHILLGAAGGGVWETKDAGASWAPRTDTMPSLAIGAIAFDPAKPKQVYAGSGEGNFYRSLGAGVYRSTDGGTTWKVLAAAPFVGVGFYDLVVDPKDSSILYAATTNGFYKSVNGGATWSQKRAVWCWDVSVHPGGGTVELLAAFQDGLFVSTNGGNSFAAVALPSAPGGGWTRLDVDRVVKAPDVAYAFGASGGAAHLWRRAGTTWTKITTPAAMNVNQAWYDWYVAAPPDSKTRVFLGAIDTYRGELSGGTWTWTDITTQGNNSIHPDQHCLAFVPGASKTLYAGNDGGIYRSTNNGATWKPLVKGLGITEIEYMAGDPGTWKWLMAGTQDNGTLRFVGTTVWDHIADGDGGDCGVDQQNPNTIYHSYYNVSLERSPDKGATWTWLAPPSLSSLFYPPVEVAGKTVAIGASSLVVSRTEGTPWATFALGLSGGEVATAMRAIDPNTLLVGTNTGRIVKVTWGGANWTKVQLTSPVAKYISCIAVDPSNTQRIWVTSTQVSGPPGRVFRSDDGGAIWVDRTAGLPAIPINSVVVDPANFKRVWVAADVGVYQTLNLGGAWVSFGIGLPNAMAVDLLLHKQDRMLVCATRNRGAWAIPVP